MPHWEKDLIWWVNLEYLVYRLPAKENLVLYVRITFAELKRLDILWDDKQLRRPIWDCGGWVPETSWSYHYWQPAPRWRPHWWLAKPDNPAMSPHALDKTGTRHIDTQWKAEGREGREQKPLNAPHIMLLLPAPLINKPYSPKHEEFHACASILIQLTSWLQTLLVVYLVKLELWRTSCIKIYIAFK